MRGHIRPRGKFSWQLKIDIGRDAAGKRQTEFHTFRGTKREAQQKLAELIAAVGKGAYVPRSSVTVGEHVAERIEQWHRLGKISDKTAERYGELHWNQIAPYLGPVPLQSLKSSGIERWHAELKTSGRRDGTGGLWRSLSGTPIACCPRRSARPRGMIWSCAMSPATKRRRELSARK